MRFPGILLPAAFAAALLVSPSPGLADPAAELEQRITSAASAGGFEVSILAEDSAGRPVHLVRAGDASPSGPAVFVVAGLDGRHTTGTEMALALIEDLAASGVPENVTVYVVPRVNHAGPAAAAATPRRARATIAGEGDHDRDGLVAEDLADDLDGDGIISTVLVRDPDGTQVLDGTDQQFPREAKRTKGERGEWLVLSEGRDDDGDEAWNEEEDGGTNLARNFTHGYEWFAKGAGVHQVSTAETRALADFLVDHPEISAVLVYGPENNLLASPPAGKVSDPDLAAGRWGRKPVTDPNKDDVPWITALGEEYRKILSLGDEVSPELSSGAEAGGFAAFVYYSRGRLALATPAWAPEVQLKWNAQRKADEEEKVQEAAKTEDVKVEGAEEKVQEEVKEDQADEEEEEDDIDPKVKSAEELRDWLLEANPSAWLGWKPLEHPDFPGQEALVGGFDPLAQINPPGALLEDLAAKHTQFTRSLLGQLPRVGIRDVEWTALGGGLFEAVVTVENTGGLPDRLAHGVFSTHVRATRLEIDAGDGALVGSYSPMMIDRLAPHGGAEKVRFVVSYPTGSGTLGLALVSEHAGRDARTLCTNDAKEAAR